MAEFESYTETILVVDDEPLNRKLLRGHLERWGYHILSASSGQEALELVQEQPDLILLDIMMPGLDGLETCRLLKQMEGAGDIPVIFLSALDDAEHKAKGLEAGGVDYLSKPFFSKELQARVRTHLTLRRQELKLRQYNDALEDMVRERSSKLRNAEQEIKRDYDIQTILNELLHLSLSGESSQKLMNTALERILSIGWLPTLDRGCIYVADREGVLSIKAWKNVDDDTLERCSQLKAGHCICGNCLRTRTLQLANSDDPLHASCVQPGQRHADLCIPILKGDTVLGMINLHLEYGYVPDSKDSGFISSLANTLAQIIVYSQAQDHIIASEANYRSVFESTGTIMAILDQNRDVILANTRFNKLFINDADETPPCNILSFIHEEDRERFVCIHENTFNSQALMESAEQALDRQVSHELRFLSASRHMLDVVLTMSSIPGTSKSIISLADITDRKNAERQLMYHAFHDALTGLPNRSMFLDNVNSRIADPKQSSKPFVVMLMDLDRFAIINESLGHTLGDKLLVAVAGRLVAIVGSQGFVARLGGDEFALFIEDMDGNQAGQMAQDILDLFKEPFALEGSEFFSTTSIGIATSEGDYLRAEDMLRDADAALHRAKLGGKSRHEIFDQEMYLNATKLMTMVNDMRFALDRKEFFLLYQPLVKLESGSPIGVEALVRWRHPERGVISPIDFIPLAEDTGFINQLGIWVMAEACASINAMQPAAEMDGNFTVSVNLSVRQFDQENIFEQIEQTLNNSGLPPNRLKLEVTESAIMQDADRAVNILNRLKDLDVRILVDDFGTGYSSLSYLHRLPLDMLKIDRSFVSRMAEGGEYIETVRTIISLANNLGLDVIAEGVETEEQRKVLMDLGCNLAQGYLFSPPVALEDVIRLMAGNRP